jgi:hypothetical protein
MLCAMAATPIATMAYRPFLGGMRSPIVAPLTRFLIGLPLVLLTTQTATYFAWTIEPPMTAAFLGANYWSSALLAMLAARETLWARGRVSVSVALAFAPLTTIATFLHLGQFHLDTVYGWFWVAAYTVYPLQLGYFLVRQLRTPGNDPPRERALPTWVKAILGLQAVLLIPLGVALFLIPNRVAELWPWVLPPLSARAVSAWLIAFGVLAAHAIVENDFMRVRSAMLGYPFAGALHALMLVRFSGDVRWEEPGAMVYVGFIVSFFALGIWGFLTESRARRAAAGTRSLSGRSRSPVPPPPPAD